MRFFKNIIVIPARYASTRFPGKMLALAKGKTLLQHTYENVLRSKRLGHVLIATDHPEIHTHAKAFGADVMMTPLSCLNGTHRVFHAIQNHPKVSNQTIIINVQGDEPLINPECLDRLIEELTLNPKVDMATLASPFKTLEEALKPSNVKCVFNQKGEALYFSRALIPHTRDPQKAYHHLGIYAFRKNFLTLYESLKTTPLQTEEDLEQLKALEHGYKIKVLIEKTPSFGVDLPEDLEKLEQHL